MKNPRSISDALRSAIAESGLTRYEISKRSGVPQSALSRFVKGERSISLETLDKLAEVLDVELLHMKRKGGPLGS
jgi:transcriptional regulator with XRE-family HTH domain